MYFIPIYILVLFAAIIIDYWAGLKIQSATDPTLKNVIYGSALFLPAHCCSFFFVH